EQGWVALLAQRLRAQGYGYQIVNASVSGETTSGGLERLPRALQLHQPGTVILELGANDGLRGLPVSETRENLARIVRLSQAAGAQVLLVGMRIPPNYGPRYTEQFARVFPELANQYQLLLEETCARHAERVAFIQMGAQLTYRQLDELTRAFAAWLQQQGFGKGERLAIMLPNTLQYPIAMFGALRAGLIVVNTNPLYTAPELLHQLSDSGATAILVLENFAHVLQQVLPGTRVKRVLVTAVGDFLGFPKSLIVNYVVRHLRRQVPRWNIPGATSFKAAVTAGLKQPLAPVEVGPEDLAFLQYTGGTTGVAKGAMLSHGNVSTNVLQAEAWLGKRFQEPAALITAI